MEFAEASLTEPCQHYQYLSLSPSTETFSPQVLVSGPLSTPVRGATAADLLIPSE